MSGEFCKTPRSVVHRRARSADALVAERTVALAETRRGESLRDLFSLPLLHLDTRPDAWERWALALGQDIECPVGMLFDQFAPMIEAADSWLRDNGVDSAQIHAEKFLAS